MPTLPLIVGCLAALALSACSPQAGLAPGIDVPSEVGSLPSPEYRTVGTFAGLTVQVDYGPHSVRDLAAVRGYLVGFPAGTYHRAATVKTLWRQVATDVASTNERSVVFTLDGPNAYHQLAFSCSRKNRLVSCSM